jgi:hypothetical protein
MKGKFLVSRSKLLLGNVSNHRDLLTNQKKIQGGGSWVYLKERKLIIFFGTSAEFGPVSFNELVKSWPSSANKITFIFCPVIFNEQALINSEFSDILEFYEMFV